eukprot:1266744-Pyramimonas_sp.AAC.1
MEGRIEFSSGRAAKQGLHVMSRYHSHSDGATLQCSGMRLGRFELRCELYTRSHAFVWRAMT